MKEGVVLRKIAFFCLLLLISFSSVTRADCAEDLGISLIDFYKILLGVRARYDLYDIEGKKIPVPSFVPSKGENGENIETLSWGEDLVFKLVLDDQEDRVVEMELNWYSVFTMPEEYYISMAEVYTLVLRDLYHTLCFKKEAKRVQNTYIEILALSAKGLDDPMKLKKEKMIVCENRCSTSKANFYFKSIMEYVESIGSMDISTKRELITCRITPAK
jgi:hypothetical protein